MLLACVCMPIAVPGLWLRSALAVAATLAAFTTQLTDSRLLEAFTGTTTELISPVTATSSADRQQVSADCKHPVEK